MKFSLALGVMATATLGNTCWTRQWSWPNDHCVLKSGCAAWESNSGFGGSWESCCDGHCTGTGTVNPNSPTPPPSLPPSMPPTTQTAPPTTFDGEKCVTHASLMAINGDSTFWPECDPSMSPKGSATGREFGHYCNAEWDHHLNVMLSELGYCHEPGIIRNFLAQAAYETGYYSTLGQPLDDGSGVIHMIPQNFEANARDMDAVFPGQGLFAAYEAAPDKQAFFKMPQYAWKSAAAWFKATNRVIPGCGGDLFTSTLDEQTRCILGRVVNRDEALEIVSRHIPLSSTHHARRRQR